MACSGERTRLAFADFRDAASRDSFTSSVASRQGSPSRRDAATSTRDACAPRIAPPRAFGKFHDGD